MKIEHNVWGNQSMKCDVIEYTGIADTIPGTRYQGLTFACWSCRRDKAKKANEDICADEHAPKSHI